VLGEPHRLVSAFGGVQDDRLRRVVDLPHLCGDGMLGASYTAVVPRCAGNLRALQQTGENEKASARRTRLSVEHVCLHCDVMALNAPSRL
jgi:hypothetical protein